MTGESTLLTGLFSSDAAYRLTLSLGHTLWQGVVIGAAALLLARLLRDRSAQSRHLTYMATLLAMALCLPTNLIWVAGPEQPGPAHRTAASQPDNNTAPPSDDIQPGPAVVLPPDSLTTLLPDTMSDPGADFDAADDTADLPRLTGVRDEASALTNAHPTAAPNTADAQPAAPATPSRRARAWRAAASWVVPIYGLGLLLAGARLILAYRGGQRLRRLAVRAEVHAPTLVARFREQARRLGIASIPEFAVLPKDLPGRYAYVGPVVIGVLKPVVMLPAAAITQMTPAQVEAVLAHELAHIKRYDPWLMLFQRAAETLLFFHPMVWLISRLASVEREHACDDLAINAGAQPGHYAEALLHFAKRQADLGSKAPRTLAAAALAMAQRSAQGKALENRLARLFGRRIPNPLRLTRKGLLSLILVGLVGLTTLITTTRAQPPGPYFTQAEIIPALAYPDPTAAPHPPLAMQVKFVRPMHTSVLFTPDGDPVEETWMDYTGSHNYGRDDDLLRDILIELPDDCPPLTFAPTGCRMEVPGGVVGLGSCRPELCYRADGTPYILIREHFRHHHLGHQPRIDLTLAYFVGDERGDAEAAFTGPFLSGRSVADPSRMYRITTTITRKHNAGPDDWSATIELPKALDPMDASVMDSYLIAYDKWGRAFTLENLSYRDLPLGRGEMTFVLEGHDGPGLEDVARLALNETPRTTTFRNIVVDWEGWTDREEPYPPYIDAMAAHLGWPVETEADREAILHSDLTVEEALVVVDVAQNYAATRVWRTLRDAEPRLSYDDLTAQEQARVLAAATNWIDASDPQIQRAGLEMGLWSGDMRFWAPAVAHIRRKGYRASGVLYDLSRQLAGQMQSGHFNDLITLVDTAESAGDIDGVMAAFRLTGSHVQPTQRRKATVDALVELARHDDPWVWYAAINRIHENSHTLHDADHQPARETVLPRLAAESDEMLRRCAIVVPDADALGRPLPPRETLRLEPLFTPAMWRMLRIGDFFDLYDHWVTDDPADLDQWDRVVGFLDQLDDEWSLSRGDGWSLDNSVIVHRVVQHLNAVFDQDLGGLGQVRTETASRVGNDRAYRRIAREAVAWYRGVEGPAEDRQAEGVEVDRADLIGTWRLNDEDSAVPYTDAAGLDPGSHGSMETAEAFIAALLTARVGDAEALTHAMDERRCGRFAELALLDIGDDFGATAVYRDLRDRDDRDEDEVGEAADGDDNAGGGTIGVVFAPIDVPAELADQDEAQRMALIVEVQRVDGLWRVTGIDAEELGEDFYAQVQQAHDTGRIEIIPHEAEPLPPRIVGYRDPKPLDLHRAIMAGDLERVEALLEAHPAWVHARLAIEGNNTPLHTAVTQACWSYNKTEQDGRRGVALFGLLLDHGADINATNADGRTVLSAFCGGYAPIGRSQPEAGMAALRLLIEHGADVHHADDDGRTPLFNLALSSLGHRQTAHQPIADAAALLLEAGADPDHAVGSESDDRMRTPMHLALYERNPYLLAALLDDGADPAGPDMRALPPLHALAIARYRNNTSNAERKAVLERDTLACARLLVEHGADPWMRVLSDRISTTGATNLRGIECTAWDWAPDSAMREYLGELMAPRRAELEAEVRAIAERFVRAALAGDTEAMRSDTTEVFVLHDPQPTQRMLPHVAELLRNEINVDLDDDNHELPIIAITGRLREGGILLRNKEGSATPYTAILTIHDGERWRVIAARSWHRDAVIGAIQNLFDFRRDSIGYVRHQITGELPVAFGGSRTGAVHRAESAVVGLNQDGQMTMQWHGRGRHIATSQLTRDDTDGVVHIDHTDLKIHHNRGTLTYNDIVLKHNDILLPDGTRLVTIDGQLAVLKDGNADLLPPGGTVSINLTDHRYEIIGPAPPGNNAGGAPDGAANDNNGARSQAEDFAQPMGEAIAAMDAQALGALLERGADPNAPLPNGLLPLHAVVSARDRAGSWADPAYDDALNNRAVACARLLVEAGADPWARMIARGSDGAWWYNMEQPALDTITPGNMRDKPLYAYLEALMRPRLTELRHEVHTALHAFVQAAMNDDVEAMLANATPVWPSHRNYFPRFMAAMAETYRETLETPDGDRAFVLPIETDWVREQEAGVLLRNRDGAEKTYTLFLLIHDGNAWRAIESIETDREDISSFVWNLHGQYPLVHYIRFAASRRVPPIMHDTTAPQTLRTHDSETAVIRSDRTGRIVVDWIGQKGVVAQTCLGLPDAEGVVHVVPAIHNAAQLLEAAGQDMRFTHDTVTLPDGATLRVDDAGRLVLRQGDDTQPLPAGAAVRVSLADGSYEGLAQPDANPAAPAAPTAE